jgi:ribose transport system substrate-binding protein
LPAPLEEIVPASTPASSVRPTRARLRAAALLGSLALAVSACVGPVENNGPTATLAPTATPPANPYHGAAAGSGSGVKLGYISFGDLVPFVKDVSDGIAAEATAAGAQLTSCDAALEASKVDGCLQELTTAGVKAIAVFQDLRDPSAVCGKVPSGVPVIAIEFGHDACQKAYVGADDLEAGRLAGTKVGEFAKAKWSCQYDAYVSLESAAAPDRSQKRMEGYRLGFQTVCPGTIQNERVERTADRTDTAQAAVAAVLTELAGKQKIIVVAVNDDAVLGALKAADAAGRLSDVWISGQGGDSRVRETIRTNPNYIGDAAYRPELYGKTAVPALLDAAAGRLVVNPLLIDAVWLDATTIGAIYPK